MDKLLLKHYHELKLENPLPFFNWQWNKCNNITGPEIAVEMNHFMGSIKHASSAPFYYLMRELTYKLYLEGKGPRDAWSYFDIPLSTAEGHFELYKKRYPLI